MTLRGHPAYITALDFRAEGKQLCSGDQLGWSIWWSLETRRPLCIWKSHSENIVSSTCQNDLLFTHGRDNKLKVWRLEMSPFFNVKPPNADSDPEKYPQPWLVHSQDINALNFCSVAVNGNLFATPSTLSSEKLDIYTLAPFGRPVKALAPEIYESPQADDPVKLGITMCIRLYDDYLVIGYESGHVAVYAWNSKQPENEPDLKFLQQLHKDTLQSMTRVENYLYTSGSDTRLCRLDLDSFEHITTKVPKGTPTITTLASTVYTAGWDGHVRTFSLDLEPLSDQKEIRQVSCLAVSAVAPSTERRLRPLPAGFVAVAGKDARISLHEITNSAVAALKC